MEKKDCFLKDEGDFFTLGFQSEKAKKILSDNINLNKLSYSIENNLPKINISIELLDDIIVFLNNSELTYDSDC
jgi:hypothetical protein